MHVYYEGGQEMMFVAGSKTNQKKEVFLHRLHS